MDTKAKLRLAIPAVVIALVVVTVLVVSIVATAGNVSSTVSGDAAQQDVAAAAEGEVAVPACEFDFLVGLSSADAEARVKPLDRPYRILAPHTPATMDFSPVRINILTDDAGVVQSVHCG